MIDRMDQEANDLKRQGLKMSWYMRGGASYDDVMNLISVMILIMNVM